MAKLKKAEPILLDGNSLSLDRLGKIIAGNPIKIAGSTKRRIVESSRFVQEVAKGDTPVYGINTGFGFFARQKVEPSKLKELQVNILRSHAAGSGAPLSVAETKAAMVLRLNVLLKGYTGIRFELCKALFDLIDRGITPIVPEFGSVGASGDLAPLAHLALPLIGEGLVLYRGQDMSARNALKKARLKKFELSEKEGLSLVNGTQVMLAVGGLALIEALKLVDLADRITALSFEGMEGLLAALDPKIHKVRGHSGQIESARRILKELRGSYLFDGHRLHNRVQDPYSLRCAAQVHGPSRESLLFAKSIVETELNAATDNPLVFTQSNQILSGGNFHGQPLAMAFDVACLAVSELANISERRIELLLNPHSSGLPAFLIDDGGTNSGYMAMQYLAASLVNDNKIHANPAVTDSIPGNVGVEDHVSMGMTSARKLRQIVRNTKTVLACEMLAAAQAIDLRGIKKLGFGTREIYKTLRKKVPKLKVDRIIAVDIERARKCLAEICSR